MPAKPIAPTAFRSPLSANDRLPKVIRLIKAK